MAAAGSSSNPSSSQSPLIESPFHSYPQQFPRAQQAAKRAASHILGITQRGPRSQVGQVVDTSFHVSQGYVLCTTNHVIVRVYGVPYGTVVPQMRLFIRQLGAHAATNQSYVFDGYAPNLSGLGSQGSVLLSQVPTTTLSAGVCMTGASGMQSITGLSAITGYYWHLFFYVPQLPASTVTLFHMLATSGGTSLTLDYSPTGILSFYSQDGNGYKTTQPISPHNAHWLFIQPNAASATNEFLVDGVSSYTNLVSTNEPTFAGNALAYQGSYLSTVTGTKLCPLGSWVSKMGFGASYLSGSIVSLLSTIGTTTPSSDSQIPVFNTSTMQKSLNTYVCEDTLVTPPTAQTLVSGSSSWGSTSPGSTITLNGSVATLQVPGPY